VIAADGSALEVPEAGTEPIVTRVDIQGPLEQRAGYYDPCAGWSDGHDAVAERMISALELGDVVMVIDSPGGAHAGLQEAVRRVLEEKAEHGRHIIAYANEMIGSAAYWWAACVADEIYGPESMIVGSIGARAGHASIAGALAKDGVEVTYFAWPGPGKVAFAPELPLSEVGKQRGNRDVAMAGEAFAAAVGPRRGMTRDEIVELDADALHGPMALAAKLVDGIASLEDVMTYALTLAANGSPGENEMDPKATTPKPGITQASPAARTEDPPADPDKKDPPAPPKADKMECTGCGAAQDSDAKFCDKCGEPMQPEAQASADDDEPADAAPPPPDKDPDGDPPPAKKEEATSASASGTSMSKILGFRQEASLPAQKSAALAFVSLATAVMTATGTKSPGEAEGAFQALAEEASKNPGLRAELRASKTRANRREKMDLLLQLAAKDLPGYRRGDLIVDHIDKDGKLHPQPAPIYEDISLPKLRGFVEAKTSGKAPTTTKRTPFDASPEAARTAAENTLVRADEATPFIQDISTRSTASAEQLARTARALEAQGAHQ
jgi:ClpP class serine protease